MIKPIQDYVIVELAGRDTETKSGILVASEKKSHHSGTIKEVSDGCSVEVGQKIVFRDSEEYEGDLVFVHESDIQAIIEE